MITNKNYNVDLAKSSDKKLTFEFAKEVCFDQKSLGFKSTRDKSPKGLRQSLAIMAESLKESKTRFSYTNPNARGHRVKLLPQIRHWYYF